MGQRKIMIKIKRPQINYLRWEYVNNMKSYKISHETIKRNKTIQT